MGSKTPRLDATLSRRQVLRLFGAGACLAQGTIIPTVLGREALAEPATSDKLPGRIFLYKHGEELSGLLAFDPNESTWEMLPRGIVALSRVSHDGRWLAQELGLPTQKGGLTLYDLSGEKPPATIFERPTTRLAYVVWTGDNQEVITSFSTSSELTKFETWKVSTDRSRKVRLPTPASRQVIDATPDGRWFLTLSESEGGGLLARAVSIMRPDGKEERSILAKPNPNQRPHEEFTQWPRLSPDGRTIVFVTRKVGEQAGGRAILGFDLELIDTDGKNRRRLLEGNLDCSYVQACWSPDGRYLAVSKLERAGDEPLEFRPRSRTAKGSVDIVDREGKLVQALRVPPSAAYAVVDWR